MDEAYLACSDGFDPDKPFNIALFFHGFDRLPEEQIERHGLVEQVTGTVRWRESIAFMAAQGVTTFYEIGAGKVLSGLVKRIAETAAGISVGTPADIAAFKTARQG